MLPSGIGTATSQNDAVEALRRRVLPPTMHLDVPDPDCDLDYVAGRAREVAPFAAAASNSFAFGGTNAVLVATRATLGPAVPGPT
ncbi:MAG: hypothetical protein O9284_13870 [Steroidobacteraceae bacterium]|nr:hypothetical protein [Steroidobacteraceae bacterium]